MKLTPPKPITFWIAIVLGVLALIGKLVSSIPVISAHAFTVLLLGFIVLVVGVLVNGL
ncbi:MAG: hypothetical protein ABSG98_03040 [Anaerolineales bacterium]|jgi:hypothetical protein